MLGITAPERTYVYLLLLVVCSSTNGRGGPQVYAQPTVHTLLSANQRYYAHLAAFKRSGQVVVYDQQGQAAAQGSIKVLWRPPQRLYVLYTQNSPCSRSGQLVRWEGLLQRERLWVIVTYSARPVPRKRAAWARLPVGPLDLKKLRQVRDDYAIFFIFGHPLLLLQWLQAHQQFRQVSRRRVGAVEYWFVPGVVRTTLLPLVKGSCLQSRQLQRARACLYFEATSKHLLGFEVGEAGKRYRFLFQEEVPGQGQIHFWIPAGLKLHEASPPYWHKPSAGKRGG